MKRFPALVSSALVLGACGAETPEPKNVPPVNLEGSHLEEDLPPDNAAAVGIDEFLKRLNESEGESSEKWDPLEKPDRPYVSRRVFGVGTQRDGETGEWHRLDEIWKGWNHEERRAELERMAGEDNTWAKGTLHKLDEGEISASDLDDAGDRYLTETVLPRRSYTIRLRSDNGCAPMPFGGSMHGPWDTGGAYSP